MRIHIDDTGTPLSPELRGWLAERLDAMNTPTAEIFEARVTCGTLPPHQRSHTQIQVKFLLAGQTLCVVQAGATLTEAAQAVLHAIVQQLRAVRPQRRGCQTLRPHGDTPLRSRGSDRHAGDLEPEA
jgi:hypothetical protein